MTEPSVIETLRVWIGDQFLVDGEAALLTPETPLISGGILDSIATLGLVAFLEERYGIEFEAHEVSRERLDTLAAIERLVLDKRARLA
jgi:acyl carrier protein